MFQKQISNKNGFVMVDILIAIAILAVALVALLEVGAVSIKMSGLLEKKANALFLAKETMESARSFRDGSAWASGLGVALTGSANPYHLNLNTGTSPAVWELSQGAETLGIFTRKIVFDRVSRDPSTSNIESIYNPLNDDEDTRKATITVSWETYSVELVTYFTNWK